MGPQNSPLPTIPKNPHRAVYAAVILGVLLVVAVIFGYSVYQSKQDYKNNSDKKAAAAAAVAAASATAKQKATDELAAKAPFKTFTGPATYGSVSFSYPKTWSAYVDQSGTDEPINGYFYPEVVPGVQSNAAFALRVELVNTAYADVVDGLQSSAADGALNASAYIPPKMKGVSNVQPGMMFTGTINGSGNQQFNGTMVVIKVRDKTLQVYTESANFASDFNNIVLPSLSFSP